MVGCQVVRPQAWRHITLNEGSQRARARARVQEINEFLKSVCLTDRISFWPHKLILGWWQKFVPSQWLSFKRYLNDRGNYKLWRSVKGAVFLAVKDPYRPGAQDGY